MKRIGTWLTSLLCMALLLSLYPVTASADIGPKPSVEVCFDNVGDEPCYGTLLSSTESTGPWSVWDGSRRNARYTTDAEITEWSQEAPYEIWWAFVQYEDPDGFCFLQMVWDVRETGRIDWTYYPPDTFKILLYYPESGRFAVSGAYPRYAFHAEYSVDLEGGTAGALRAVQAVTLSRELPSFAARILMTLAVELAVALLFGIRKRKQLLCIAVVNIVTQLLLNLLLFYFAYHWGRDYTVGLEAAVTALEALVYCLVLGRFADGPPKKAYYVFYAIVANAASYGLGLLLAARLPGLF